MKKKGDLSISVNAIVIIVIALTFLSLALVFIRNIFEGISETTITVQEQIKQQILDDLRRGDKKLSFPADEITVAKGRERIFGIGVKNTLDVEADFYVEIWSTDGEVLVPSSTALPGSVAFFWDINPVHLQVNEIGVIGIKVIGPTATSVSDIYKLVICQDAVCADKNQYSAKSFFVKSIG
ncbi:MAG TPA: hypothetical protein VJI46_04690 [Candidatus Nanoarchaeia archaeon]|nr:hypothetical protein [Candidatus Nanoarchaeia archaeon]